MFFLYIFFLVGSQENFGKLFSHTTDIKYLIFTHVNILLFKKYSRKLFDYMLIINCF